MQQVVTDCSAWPEEGEAAYAEIQRACGGSAMPNCPNHKEWRSRQRKLKDQLDALWAEAAAKPKTGIPAELRHRNVKHKAGLCRSMHVQSMRRNCKL